MSTARLRQRVEADFPAPGAAAGVLALLEGFVDELRAGARDDGWEDWAERVQAAVVLLARGSVGRLGDAMSSGLVDWRDLLVASELADGDWPARLDLELGPRRPG
ncbi:hypothetical protein OG937_25580 [Streptomyces sp. NBC_00510]